MNKEETFLKLIAQNERLIFKIASLYTNCKEDREDLMQEIVYQLWKSFDSFEFRSSESTWLYRVGINTALYFLKKGKRKIDDQPLYLNSFQIADDTQSEKEAQIAKLRHFISELNVLDRSIVILYLEEKSHEEIANIIGISKSNVGTRISRIKEKLKAKSKKYQGYGS